MARVGQHAAAARRSARLPGAAAGRCPRRSARDRRPSRGRRSCAGSSSAPAASGRAAARRACRRPARRHFQPHGSDRPTTAPSWPSANACCTGGTLAHAAQSAISAAASRTRIIPAGGNRGLPDFWRIDARRQGYGIMGGITTWGARHERGSHAHHARRAVDRRAHRRVVLDHAAVPGRADLGDDDRRRHLAGAACAGARPAGQALARHLPDDAADAAGVRAAVLGGHQHAGGVLRPGRSVDEVAAGRGDSAAAGVRRGHSRRRREGGRGLARRGERRMGRARRHAAALRRAGPHLGGGRGGRHRAGGRADPADDRHHRGHLRERRSVRVRRPPVRPPARGRARRAGGPAGRPGDPRRRAGRRRDGAGAVAARRPGPVRGRHSVRRRADRG